MIHDAPSTLAGKTVRIKETGDLYKVEDWWDRIAGKSWGDCDGNPACLAYALRAGGLGLPPDDEVLYGKIGPLGHLIHMTEIEVPS
jgi:hypothetical protein